MFIREATEEDYESVRKGCLRMINDDKMRAFGSLNFVDYSKCLDNLRAEFPQLVFTQECFGLTVDKKEE